MRINSDSSRVPMDKDMFIKGRKEFEAKGGKMIQDENGDIYLNARDADAITLDEHTIVFRSGSPPTLSEYHEELMHASQFERGVVSTASMIDREIEVKKELIRLQAEYGISDSENDETKRQLDGLLKLLKIKGSEYHV